MLECSKTPPEQRRDTAALTGHVSGPRLAASMASSDPCSLPIQSERETISDTLLFVE